MILDIKNDELVTIAGMRKAGKTQLAMNIIKGLTTDYFIYDINDEYKEFPDDHRYVPQTESMEEFDSVCQMIWGRGNIIFFVDEAEQFMNVRKPLSQYMMLITRRGRHRGIGAVAITRRIAEFNKEFFSLSDHVFLFRVFSPNDIRYIQEFLGNDAEKLRHYPNYEYMHYSYGNIEENLKVEFGTEDISIIDRIKLYINNFIDNTFNFKDEEQLLPLDDEYNNKDILEKNKEDNDNAFENRYNKTIEM